MDEKSLLPLIIVEDSDEEDNQDSHDLVNKSSRPSLRHTASVFFGCFHVNRRGPHMFTGSSRLTEGSSLSQQLQLISVLA